MRPSIVLRLLPIFVLLVFACSSAIAAERPSSTDSSPPTAATLTPEKTRAAIAGMSDEQVRALLIHRIDEDAARTAAAAARGDAVALVADDAQTIRYRLGEMIAAAPDLLYAGLFILDELTEQRDQAAMIGLLSGFAVIIVGAALAEWLFRRLLRRLYEDDSISSPRTDFGRLGLLAVRALAETLALTVFAVAATFVFFALYPDQELVRRAFWASLLTILATRGAAIAGRVLLAPHRPELRLPALTDADAVGLFRWLLALTALVSFTATFGLILAYTKLPEALLLAFGTALQWIVIAALLTGIWVKRRSLDRLVGMENSAAGRSAGPLLARHWHVLFAVGVIGMGLFATASRLLTEQPQAVPIVETLLIVAAVPAIDGLLRMLVRHLLSPIGATAVTAGMSTVPTEGSAVTSAAAAEAPPGGESTAHDSDYAPVILRNLRIVLAVLVLLALGGVWSIDIGRIAAGSLGSRVADALFTIVVALLLASALWGVVKTAVDRHVPREALDPHAMVDGEGGQGGLSRLQTLLPVVRKFLFTTIVVMVGMTVVSALGVDIGPLLAGAGVVGIAIGFGAQALVRDIVSGIFFLIDDAFRVGEYIDVGVAKGTVERISIRSLRLRHHLGQINTIPFGEIKTVTNYSRDWAIMKLELRVPLDTDIEKVRKLVKRVGQEMQQNPELAMALLQPPKSQGVHRMEPSAYVVRVKYMATPGEQFTLRREVFRRLQEVFRENGIRLGVSPTVVDAANTPATSTAAAGRFNDEPATGAGP